MWSQAEVRRAQAFVQRQSAFLAGDLHKAIQEATIVLALWVGKSDTVRRRGCYGGAGSARVLFFLAQN